MKVEFRITNENTGQTDVETCEMNAAEFALIKMTTTGEQFLYDYKLLEMEDVTINVVRKPDNTATVIGTVYANLLDEDANG